MMARRRREKNFRVRHITKQISIKYARRRRKFLGDLGGVFIKKYCCGGENSPPQAGNF